MDNKDIHGGNPEAVSKLKTEIKADFSVNLNPLGPPTELLQTLNFNHRAITDYPAPDAAPAEKALAEKLKVNPENIIAGSGATELFALLLQALKPGKVAYSSPSYSGYAELCAKQDIEAEAVAQKRDGLRFEHDFGALAESDAEIVFICSPNNPTGQVTEAEKILSLAQKCPGKTIVADESFIDFVPDSEKISLFGKEIPGNVIVVKSLTKFFAIAGLRIGVAFGDDKLISDMKRRRLPWSLNGPAQEIAELLYRDKKYVSDTVSETTRLKKLLYETLEKFPELVPFPSEANFVLAEIKNSEFNADTLRTKLLEQGVFIRSCSRIAGLGPEFIRLAVRPERELVILENALQHTLSPDASQIIPAKKKKAKGILVVGTTSNAGKSIITAAICRYLHNHGHGVAPFKAQNMALNSFVTKEGGEMGRAQVVQAEACRIEAHTDMNPVLLKPTGDSGSQIIIDGQAVANMCAKDYYRNKEKVREKAVAAYDRLSEKYDFIVMEGAGSPAEINMLDDDFVNMRMAEYAEAPSILVADIDRGGVFASIYGTIKLLPENYRKLIRGIIINKFRGDVSLLEPGIRQIEDLCEIPVLGVMPFLKNLNIEDEDSLGLENRRVNQNALVNILVVRLPRISNYTDFLSLENTPGISLRYISSPRKISDADMIIIPGSKNTIADMIFLRESGFEPALKKAAEKGVPICGICGGYQMLGEKISDPDAVEGDIREVRGLGLLPIETVLEKEKELAQVAGLTAPAFPFCKPETEFRGYEIHAGKSSATQMLENIIRIKERKGIPRDENAGSVSANGKVWGCYVHGFFDAPEIRKGLLEYLCSAKNIKADVKNLTDTTVESKDVVFDRLAKEFAKNIDVKKIISIIQDFDLSL